MQRGLTITKYEPKNTEGGTYPRSVEGLLVGSNIVQNSGPVFARENLVHAEEGVVDIKEGDPNGLLFRRRHNLASEELCSENRGKKG